jgi:serine protease
MPYFLNRSLHARLAGRTVAAILSIFMVPAALQAQPPSDLRTVTALKRSSGDERLNRLIVKFKEEAHPTSDTGAAVSGHARANALNSQVHRRPDRPHAAQLSYLKSVTLQTHVMLSDALLSRAEMTALILEIGLDPQVEYAEVDERVFPLFVPNDPSYSTQQWSLKAPAEETGGANFPNAWGRLIGGQPVKGTGVIVAVLDTGYQPHTDLAANTINGYDFVSTDAPGVFTTANDGDARDASALDPGDWNTNANDCTVENSSWHGTRVAGIIGAIGNNNIGIIGGAYGAGILQVRVLGVCGGYTSDVAAGIQWAAGLNVPGVPDNTAHVAKVINLSLGSRDTGNPNNPCPNGSVYKTAIGAALAAGSVVVVATGNDGNKSINSPANCAGVIAVTAHTRLGDNADYANIGIGTSISGPGGGTGTKFIGDASSIYSTANTGVQGPAEASYAGAIGTSFAAPHVSAVAALLLQINPLLTPAQVSILLTSTARAHPVGTYCSGRSDCGAGMLDGFNAVQALLQALSRPNTAPVMPAISAQTVAAAGILQFTATGSDVDGDTVTFTASGLPPGASFNRVSGIFSWDYALPGSYLVVITPSDGVASGASVSVSITVTGSLPSASSGSDGGGGGKGSVEIVDVLLCLLLAAALCALKKTAATHPDESRSDRNGTTSSSRLVGRKIDTPSAAVLSHQLDE